MPLQPGIDATFIDTSVDPCEDFYQHACGGFINANPVSGGGAETARRNAAFYATEQVEQSIVTDAAPSSPLGAVFSSCAHAGAGTQSKADLTTAIAQINAIQDLDGIASTLASLHAIGVSALFGFGSTRSLDSPGMRVAFADQDGIGLPDRSYYIDTSMPWIAEYRTHIGTLSGLAGVKDPAIADAVVSVETQLAVAMLPREDLRDPTQSFHLQDFAAFQATTPDFHWQAYVTAAAAPAFTSIDVTVPSFFTGLETVLKSTSIADVKRYLMWRVVEALADALGDDAVAEEYHFHQGVFYGFSTPLPRPEYCLRLTASLLPWPLSQDYVASAFPAASGTAANDLMHSTIVAMNNDIDQASWLDDTTRAAAVAKLNAVQVEVGAPATWPSTDGLVLDQTSFVASQAAVYRFYFRRSLAMIGMPDDSEWFMPPNTVNAAYSAERNAIDFPAAILQAPFFDPSSSPAVNAGAIGTIMGHELTHGFDDQGRRFDGHGVLSDWWSSATASAFQDRAQCLVDQYGSFEAEPGVFVDGQLTLGENIADLGGVKLAYSALAPKGDDAKAFFLAYAQIWCENDQPDYLKTLIRTDPHSPARARVNLVLQNTPQFAAAYECHEGSPMVPAKRCAVW